eukprot:PhF_6_TR8799/c0_g1_i2/m.13974
MGEVRTYGPSTIALPDEGNGTAVSREGREHPTGLPQTDPGCRTHTQDRIHQMEEPLHPLLDQERRIATPSSVGKHACGNQLPIIPQKHEHVSNLHRKFPVRKDTRNSKSNEHAGTATSNTTTRVGTTTSNTTHSEHTTTSVAAPESSTSNSKRRHGTGGISGTTETSCSNQQTTGKGKGKSADISTPSHGYENPKSRRSTDKRSNKEKIAAIMSALETDSIMYDTPMWGMDPELQRLFKMVRTETEEQQGWDLDAPTVGTINLEKLVQTFGKQSDKLKEAVDLITKPKTFEELFVRNVTKRVGSTSKTIVKGLRTLIKNGYVAPETKPKAKVGVFTRPKPKKKTLRMIVNATPVNYAQKPPPHVTLPGLKDVQGIATRAKFVTELDGTSYFNQFLLHKDIRKWFTFTVGRQRWAWKRMPMGWAHSVYIAQAVTEALTKGIEDVEILVYIDNVYISGQTKEAVEKAKTQFLKNCATVGATFETSTPIGTKCKILGMEVDLEERTVRLAQSTVDKLQLIVEHFEVIHDEGALTNHTLWIILGNALWGAR